MSHATSLNEGEISSMQALELKERAKYISDSLDGKINQLRREKTLFLRAYDNARIHVQDHFKHIIDTIIMEKQGAVMKELQKEFEDIGSRFDNALEQAMQRKRQLEQESNRQDSLLLTASQQQQQLSTSGRGDDLMEDALMINESVNEFSDSPAAATRLNSLLERSLSNMESIVNDDNLMIDQILDELISGRFSHNMINVVKCTPDLSGVCFGHVSHELVPPFVPRHDASLLSSLIDPMDHTSIVMNALESGGVFPVGQRSFVLLTCAETDHETFFANLFVDLHDSNHNKVTLTLKERVKNSQRVIKIEFEPSTVGQHSLIIMYRDLHIANSPLKINVVANEFSVAKANTAPVIKMDPGLFQSDENTGTMSNSSSNLLETMASNNITPSASITGSLNAAAAKDTGSILMNLCVGRGRLLKQKLTERQGRMANGNGTIIQPAAQKRKDPSESNNRGSALGQFEENMEMDVKEISHKLTKVVCVDETANQYHMISRNTTTESLTLAINVEPSRSGRDGSAAAAGNSLMTLQTSAHSRRLNLVSDHLRKYSNSLVRIMDNNSHPNLQVKFVGKFLGCNFPIGVRPCHKRNLLIVCDSGNNAIKIFNNSNGALLKEIREITSQFTLRRPSAVLIDPFKDNEIYIKDDKEIFVFDLDNGCQLVRRFGYKILSRPYGLAFDSHYNLVLVDADLKNPNIYTFDRRSGEVLRVKSYKPVIQNYSGSAQLMVDFAAATAPGSSGARPVLTRNVQPFEKSKVRFICCSRDTLYAADLGRSLVFGTDLEGNMELVFGYFGRRKGEFNEPSGIHVDTDGEAIMVGDSKNDRIQIYDNKGHYKCDVEFMGEKIIRPSDIHVDADGYLYVSCFIQHCIKKFQIL